MNSEAFVKVALRTLQCSQKKLASLMDVSPTQITKWKQGEHMSLAMEEKFRKLTKIGDLDPSVVLWLGSIENSIKWQSLIKNLAELAHESAETGFYTRPLEDDDGFLLWNTLNTLIEMGVSIPEKFPADLETDFLELDDEQGDFAFYSHPITSLIYEIYRSLNSVYGFYAAYINDLIYDDDLNLDSSPAENIEPCLLSLAACKLEVDQQVAPKINKFRHETLRDYENWIGIVKETAFRAGVPLKAELFDLVYGSPDELDHEAEAESLGFNSSRLHPDVYMNELLAGMRTIHQVLPAILKKLGIDEDFKLDTSELSIGGHRNNSTKHE